MVKVCRVLQSGAEKEEAARVALAPPKISEHASVVPLRERLASFFDAVNDDIVELRKASGALSASFDK